MDPDATLATIRSLIEQSKHDTSVFYEEAGYMFDLIAGLDRWIAQGGFLPKDWGGR